MQPLLLPLLCAALAAAAVSAAATLLARPLAPRLGLIDRPGGRKAHGRPTPLLGGAAVVLGLVTAVLGALAAVTLLPELTARLAGLSDLAAQRARLLDARGAIACFLAGLGLIFATGLVDDWRRAGLPWWLKLAGQTAAAAVAVYGGARLDLLVIPALNVAGSVLWIVAIANAMNFLDHADGVCAGVGLIAAALLGAVAFGLGQPALALALFALAGALAGFLPFNFPPASIFLGDAGSQAIGYVLATLALLVTYVGPDSPGYLPALLPPVVLALPLFDMAVVVTARLRTGRPVYVADRNHLHHRLSRLGMSPRQATLTVYLATFALGAGVIGLPVATPVGAAAILAQALALMGLIAALMLFGERSRA